MTRKNAWIYNSNNQYSGMIIGVVILDAPYNYLQYLVKNTDGELYLSVDEVTKNDSFYVGSYEEVTERAKIDSQKAIMLTKSQLAAFENPPNSGLYPNLVGLTVTVTEEQNESEDMKNKTIFGKWSTWTPIEIDCSDDLFTAVLAPDCPYEFRTNGKRIELRFGSIKSSSSCNDMDKFNLMKGLHLCFARLKVKELLATM